MRFCLPEDQKNCNNEALKEFGIDFKATNTKKYWQAIADDVFDCFDNIHDAFHDLINQKQLKVTNYQLEQIYDKKKALLQELKST
jgi:hypothetical protein